MTASHRPCSAIRPLAAVGLTEAAARERLSAIKVYGSDFCPMKNVLAERDERALDKVIADATNDIVVGVHMIGPDAPEILQMAAVAVKARWRGNRSAWTWPTHTKASSR